MNAEAHPNFQPAESNEIPLTPEEEEMLLAEIAQPKFPQTPLQSAYLVPERFQILFAPVASAGHARDLLSSPKFSITEHSTGQEKKWIGRARDFLESHVGVVPPKELRTESE